MSRFVLIHGAWHGGWCWNKLIPFLKEREHTATAPDLPLAEPFEAYVETTVRAVQRSDEPVILVGHSMGGAVIAQAAEQVPDKIERLVFVTAFAFDPAGTDTFGGLAAENAASVLRGNIESTPDGKLVVKPDAIRAAFYHDCDEEDVQFAMKHLRPLNAGAFAASISVTPERYGTVPKQYIECIEDQAIHVRVQRMMARRSGCYQVNSLQTSHSPFFSAPGQLAAYLATVGIKDARKP